MLGVPLSCCEASPLSRQSPSSPTRFLRESKRARDNWTWPRTHQYQQTPRAASKASVLHPKLPATLQTSTIWKNAHLPFRYYEYYYLSVKHLPVNFTTGKHTRVCHCSYGIICVCFSQNKTISKSVRSYRTVGPKSLTQLSAYFANTNNGVLYSWKRSLRPAFPSAFSRCYGSHTRWRRRSKKSNQLWDQVEYSVQSNFPFKRSKKKNRTYLVTNILFYFAVDNKTVKYIYI